MFPEIITCSIIITIIAKKLKDYYSNRPSCATDDSIQDISNNMVPEYILIQQDISENTLISKENEILVTFYSDKNYMGDKKELMNNVYSKDDIGFEVNSMKIITKRAHIVFFNGDSRVFSYTSNVNNTIEYIKSGKLWTHVQITKF